MKKKFKLVYKGYSHEEAEDSELKFWSDVSMNDKVKAITGLITIHPLTGKKDPNAQKLLKINPIIKRL